MNDKLNVVVVHSKFGYFGPLIFGHVFFNSLWDLSSTFSMISISQYNSTQFNTIKFLLKIPNYIFLFHLTCCGMIYHILACFSNKHQQLLLINKKTRLGGRVGCEIWTLLLHHFPFLLSILWSFSLSFTTCTIFRCLLLRKHVFKLINGLLPFFLLPTSSVLTSMVFATLLFSFSYTSNVSPAWWLFIQIFNSHN